jgi:hypothetical protein
MSALLDYVRLYLLLRVKGEGKNKECIKKNRSWMCEWIRQGAALLFWFYFYEEICINQTQRVRQTDRQRETHTDTHTHTHKHTNTFRIHVVPPPHALKKNLKIVESLTFPRQISWASLSFACKEILHAKIEKLKTLPILPCIRTPNIKLRRLFHFYCNIEYWYLYIHNKTHTECAVHTHTQQNTHRVRCMISSVYHHLSLVSNSLLM